MKTIILIILLTSSATLAIWHDTITVGEYIADGERWLNPKIKQKQITLSLITNNWLMDNKDCDLNWDGIVNFADLAIYNQGDLVDVDYYEMVKYE